MKVAVVYNRDKKGIINVFGMQNREWYPEETIQRVVQALKNGGHEVELIPADRFVLSKLKKALPKLSRRRPNGIALNLALGIQGKCRYTHLPAMLEVAGIPYTGSCPLGHILALDKVVAKQIFMASGIPTPNYQVFSHIDQPVQYIKFPVIVKPRGEAASFGLKVVFDERSLKDAVAQILEEFHQPALAEEFIEGREVNVSILGNNPPVPFPVLELILNDTENHIYTLEDKFGKHRKVKKVCPAKLPKETSLFLQKLAIRTFDALNVYDYGRIDIRLDEFNQPHVLEMNSMASINPASSFVYSAEKAGYDYDQLINKIVEVSVLRYAREAPEFFREERANSETGENAESFADRKEMS
ncbi:ATP-grasp domain-containing protein [bacterium]|nr:ATP-grasp domain-containing protein [candidate division CSSED10-310 bacterium]